MFFKIQNSCMDIVSKTNIRSDPWLTVILFNTSRGHVLHIYLLLYIPFFLKAYCSNRNIIEIDIDVHGPLVGQRSPKDFTFPKDLAP